MKLKRIAINVTVALMLALTAAPALAGPAYAAPAHHGGHGGGGGGGSACPSDATSKGQVLQGLGQTGSNCSDNQLNNTLKNAVTILSIAVGIASVIVIIISGFKYIISGGESNKVSNAKNSLLYALVGLGVAATTQLLIHFVLFQTNQ